MIKTSIFGLNVGTWLGRSQALSLIAGRCSAGVAEILQSIREEKLYQSTDDTWEDFCARIGISRATADRMIRQYKEFGGGFQRLNCFVRIKPSEYRVIAPAITEEGISFQGETIPLEPENAAKIAHAVDALRAQSAASLPPDPVAQSFAKAEKAIQTALAEFTRLQGMQLDEEARLRLVLAVESGRDDLDRIRLSTTL